MLARTTRTVLVLALAGIAVPAVAVAVYGAGGSRADRSAGQPVTLRLDPVADSYTDAQQPDANFGSSPRADALVDTSTAFLKFVAPRSREPRPNLSRAYLELYTTNLASTSGGVHVTTASNAWSEKTLTAADMPVVGTTALGPVVRPRLNAYVRVPLSDLAALRPNKPMSLALSYSEPGSQFQFATRESAHPPVLVLAFGSTTAASRAETAAQPFTGSASFVGGRTQPRRLNTSLPFDWPTTSRASTSHRLVFAHYFTPYPRSLDNRPAEQDYYSQVYLKPVGSTSAYGGLLRDRPLGRSPLSGDWQLRDMEWEVRTAIAAGINGWTLDLLSPEGSNWDRDRLMMRAAHAVDPSFKVMLMPDMTASFGHLSLHAMAAKLAKLAAAPSAFHLTGGRLVLSPFEAQLWSPAKWTKLMSVLRSKYGIRTAFVPTFLYFAPYLRQYAPISYGISDWGSRTPLLSKYIAHDIGVVHGMGKLWMQTIAAQDARPDQSSYFEADNLAELRDSWHQTIEGGADWVQLATWNDFSESTAFEPSVAHGYSLLDVSSYYEAAYETGHVPTVSRNALYLTERDQFTGATPTYPETDLMRLRTPGSPASNRVEVQSFLTEPARVTIRIGSRSYSWKAPAGVAFHDVPLGYGAVSARARAHGHTLATVTAARPVVAHPYTQDLQYHAASSRREAQR